MAHTPARKKFCQEPELGLSSNLAYKNKMAQFSSHNYEEYKSTLRLGFKRCQKICKGPSTNTTD